MKDISENQVVRFKSISKKRDGLFANFRVKGVKGGAEYSTSISVDLAAATVSAADPLETIIKESARIAVKEFQKSTMQFEGVHAV